jgi:hypothetical protein
MSAPLATIRTQDDLIEALRVAKAMRGLSNDFCDQRAGLTRGHVDKVLGPTRAKSLSPMVFDLLAEIFAVQFIMVVDLEAEARMKPKWEGRDSSNVRTGQHRVSKHVIERAKPHVLREHLKKANEARNRQLSCEQRSEIARKAGRARQRNRRKNMRERLKERKQIAQCVAHEEDAVNLER